MAREFDASSNQHLSVSNGMVSGPPFTVSCWFNATAASGAQTLMFIYDATLKYHALMLNGTEVRFRSMNGYFKYGYTSTSAFSANTWHHAIGMEVSTSK